MKVPEPRKLSSGNWFIQLRLNGASVPVTASTAKECRRQAELIKAEHRAGKRFISASDQTIGQLIDAYIEKYEADLSPATVRGYNQIRNNRFTEDINKRPKDVDFQKMINRELAKGLSVKTVVNGWGAVTAALGDAKIPVPQIKWPADEVPEETAFLEPEEIQPFLDAVRGDKCELPLLLELHSLRASERIAVMQNRQWDLKRSLILVRGAVVRNKDNQLTAKKKNKSKAGTRSVPIMIPRLTELLTEIQNGQREVGHPSPNTILRHLKKCCQKAGVTEVTNHGLRHTFASLAYSLGFSEQLIMDWGGWDDPGTMHKIYVHLTNREKSKGQNAMREFYAPKTEAALTKEAIAKIKAICNQYGSLEKLKPILEVISQIDP